jgi:excisionase family DNA binding protein
MQQNDANKLLTAAELAEALKVSRRTIGNFTKSRRISAIRLGRRCVRYSLEQVRKDLEKFTQEAVG